MGVGNMTYWQDKAVLITGASDGLGNSIARTYAEAGAKIMLAARGVEKLEQATRELTDAGFNAASFTADVTKQDDVDALLAETISQFGQLDCLVNNVGRSTRGNVLETSTAEFRELMELNFLSVVRCTQAAAPYLIESRGHVVNIGSLASKSVSKFLGAYPASKFAVAAFSQQLRYELNPQGVHVLLVCPGPISRVDAGQRYDDHVGDLPESARQPGGGVRLAGIEPARLAARILASCERRRPELIVPSKSRLLFAVSQLWPSIGDWLIGRYSK